MIEWRFGLAAMTPRDQKARNLLFSLDLRPRPNLEAPQYVVPSASSIAAQPSLAAPSDHEQDWLRLAEVAQSEGFEIAP